MIAVRVVAQRLTRQVRARGSVRVALICMLHLFLKLLLRASQVEKDATCRQVIAARMRDGLVKQAPIYEDVKDRRGCNC